MQARVDSRGFCVSGGLSALRCFAVANYRVCVVWIAMAFAACCALN